MGRKKTVRPDLPPRMISRTRRKDSRVLYYYCTKGANRKEIPLGDSLPIALDEYKRLAENDGVESCAMPDGFKNMLFARVKKNAKARGIEHALTKEDLDAMFQRSNGCCELTGIEFDYRLIPGHRMRAWIPSVDRIDSSKGYVQNNCRLICACVNSALNEFGETLLIEIARGLLRTHRNRLKSDFAECYDFQHF